MLRDNQLKSWLAGACVIETLCATYLLNIPGGAPFFSVIYLISGLTIGFLLLFFPQANHSLVVWNKNSRSELLVKGLLIASMAFFLIYGSVPLLKENPIDYKTADMLPVIKTMDQRFLHGAWDHVYDNIPQIWNGSKPVYLPFMWMPFSPAVALNLDMRVVTIGALIIAFSLLILAFDLGNNRIYSLPLVIITLCLFIWLVNGDDRHGFISFSEEGLILLFYGLLAFALISENILGISMAIVLCMLSRYSGIGFVPAYFVYLLATRKKRQAFILALTGCLAVVLLFIVPFGWSTFTNILRLPGNYIDFSKLVWKDSPEVFTAGLGVARFFIPGKMNELHAALITLSFTVPFLVMGGWYIFRKKIMLNNVPISILKISLVVFYNFIDVPYLYLFYTSSVVSLIFAAQLVRRNSY
jgi:hypothetical protein